MPCALYTTREGFFFSDPGRQTLPPEELSTDTNMALKMGKSGRMAALRGRMGRDAALKMFYKDRVKNLKVKVELLLESSTEVTKALDDFDVTLRFLCPKFSDFPKLPKGLLSFGTTESFYAIVTLVEEVHLLADFLPRIHCQYDLVLHSARACEADLLDLHKVPVDLPGIPELSRKLQDVFVSADGWGFELRFHDRRWSEAAREYYDAWLDVKSSVDDEVFRFLLGPHSAEPLPSVVFEAAKPKTWDQYQW